REEPVPLRQVDRQIPRDLETIVLKAMARELSRRYATAAALAEDLKRFLADQPIQARRTRIWERALKWAKRRPAVAALLGVSGLAVVSLLAGGVWHQVQLGAALRTAEDRRLEAERAENRAEANFLKARAAVDEMLSEVGAEWLARMPFMEPVRRQLLERALHFYEGFLQEKSTEPAVRYETGRAHERVGAIYRLLGQPA